MMSTFATQQLLKLPAPEDSPQHRPDEVGLNAVVDRIVKDATHLQPA